MRQARFYIPPQPPPKPAVTQTGRLCPPKPRHRHCCRGGTQHPWGHRCHQPGRGQTSAAWPGRDPRVTPPGRSRCQFPEQTPGSSRLRTRHRQGGHKRLYWEGGDRQGTDRGHRQGDTDRGTQGTCGSVAPQPVQPPQISPGALSAPAPSLPRPFMSHNPPAPGGPQTSQGPHRHRPPFPSVPRESRVSLQPRGVSVVPQPLLAPVGSPLVPPPSQALPRPSASQPSIFLFPLLLLLAGGLGVPARRVHGETPSETGTGTAGHRQDRGVESPDPRRARSPRMAPDPAPDQSRLERDPHSVRSRFGYPSPRRCRFGDPPARPSQVPDPFQFSPSSPVPMPVPVPVPVWRCPSHTRPRPHPEAPPTHGRKAFWVM